MSPEKTNNTYDIESMPPTSEKTGLSKIEKVLAGLAIATAFVGQGIGIFLGINYTVENIERNSRLANSPNNDTTQSEPMVSETNQSSLTIAETTTDGEMTNASEILPTVESLEIDGSLLSDPEALMEVFVTQRITEWYNAGATPENARAAFASHDSVEAYTKEVAEKYDILFIEALLAKNWESNPEITKWVNKMSSIHKTTLQLYFLTSFPNINPEDITPYMRGTKVEKINSTANNADGSVVIVSTEYDYDNAELNRAGEKLTNGTKVGEGKATPISTFIEVDGKIKLSDFVFGTHAD